MREQNPELDARYQFGANTPEDLGYGYGNHRCPGGRHPNCVAKMLVIEILEEFDIAAPKGISERHRNWLFYEFVSRCV